MNQTLLTPDQVAAILQIPRSTLYDWARRTGTGPVVTKIGRLNRYHPQDLADWIAQQRKHGDGS